MRRELQPRMNTNVQKENSSMMTRVLMGAAVLAVAYAVIQNVPDIARYLRMRRM